MGDDKNISLCMYICPCSRLKVLIEITATVTGLRLQSDMFDKTGNDCTEVDVERSLSTIWFRVLTFHSSGKSIALECRDL